MGMAASKHEAFWEACGFGHTNKVKKMIEDGINVNWISYQVCCRNQIIIMSVHDIIKVNHTSVI